MTREQIEQAAKETLVNEPVEIQATKVGAFQHGFVAGAQWRINSEAFNNEDDKLAKWSVSCADALIAVLKKEGEK